MRMPAAVEVWAAKVPREYELRAREIDQDLNGVDGGGPMIVALRALGGVEGPVVGYFAEGLESLHKLLRRAAWYLAEEFFESRGIESPDNAFADLTAGIYRYWWVKFAKLRASFVLSALDFVSPGAASHRPRRSAFVSRATHRLINRAFGASHRCGVGRRRRRGL